MHSGASLLEPFTGLGYKLPNQIMSDFSLGLRGLGVSSGRLGQ